MQIQLSHIKICYLWTAWAYMQAGDQGARGQWVPCNWSLRGLWTTPDLQEQKVVCFTHWASHPSLQPHLLFFLKFFVIYTELARKLGKSITSVLGREVLLRPRTGEVVVQGVNRHESITRAPGCKFPSSCFKSTTSFLFCTHEKLIREGNGTNLVRAVGQTCIAPPECPCSAQCLSAGLLSPSA